MHPLRVFSRRGCHLCEVLIEELQPLVRGALDVSVIDVDDSPELAERYGSRVPVVEFDGAVICEYRLDREAVGELLAGQHARRGP